MATLCNGDAHIFDQAQLACDTANIDWHQPTSKKQNGALKPDYVVTGLEWYNVTLTFSNPDLYMTLPTLYDIAIMALQKTEAKQLLNGKRWRRDCNG